MTKKEILLCIISFFTGAILIFLITNFNNHEVINEEKKLISFEKELDAVFLVETYNNNILESTGTGFVYKIEGNSAYILTNEHVIKGEKIVLRNDDNEHSGKLLGKDEYLDLAVIKIDRKNIKNKLNFSSSDTIIGETVYVIGNPLGEKYTKTLTSGILSGKERLVNAELNDSSVLMSMLQTDATINHGSSGSPLLNENHEVIGIVTLKLIKEDIEGMGFAIPISRVNDYLNDLEDGINIAWPELGVKATTITNSAEISTSKIQIPSNIKDGAVILSIEENSNAEKAKLEVGDIIIEINGNKVTDQATLKYELLKNKVGDTIKIKFIRDGKTKNINLKLD